MKQRPFCDLQKNAASGGVLPFCRSLLWKRNPMGAVLHSGTGRRRRCALQKNATSGGVLPFFRSLLWKRAADIRWTPHMRKKWPGIVGAAIPAQSSLCGAVPMDPRRLRNKGTQTRFPILHSTASCVFFGSFFFKRKNRKPPRAAAGRLRSKGTQTQFPVLPPTASCVFFGSFFFKKKE